MIENLIKIYPYKNLFISGISMTLWLTFASLIGATILAIPLAFMKISKSTIPRAIGYGYTDIFRGLPSLVQLYLVYFAAPSILGFSIPAVTAGIVALSMNSAAFISEAIRGGVQSVDIGQHEAAKALGVPYIKTMQSIVLPQALRSVLPALVNESIGLLKFTSLVSIIGVTELMRAGRQVMGDTFITFEPLVIVGITYYVLVKILSIFSKFIENKLEKSVRR